MSEEEAKTEAAKAVAIPGTSEHQLGLAVDLVDANMQDLTSAQESTETQKWPHGQFLAVRLHPPLPQQERTDNHRYHL